MKLTKKSVTTEVETTETVCEITEDEFMGICASTAASIVLDIIGSSPDVSDVLPSILMTDMFAKFSVKLSKKMFADTDKPENNDKQEEK